jgi:hypothetical protein
VTQPDDALRVSDAERDAVLRTLMGGASIYRLPPQARGVSLKDARRLAKSAERGELEAAD